MFIFDCKFVDWSLINNPHSLTLNINNLQLKNNLIIKTSSASNQIIKANYIILDKVLIENEIYDGILFLVQSTISSLSKTPTILDFIIKNLLVLLKDSEGLIKMDINGALGIEMLGIKISDVNIYKGK